MWRTWSLGRKLTLSSFIPYGRGLRCALYISFLKHCILTNKAMGTLWRDMSKPPQRRQGPDPRPLWLLVGTPLVLRPELASRWAARNLLWRMSLYTYINILFCHLTCLCKTFMASPLLLVFGLFKENYLQIFKCVLLITQLLWLVGRLGPP